MQGMQKYEQVAGFADRLNEVILCKKFSYREFAKKIGCTVSPVKSWVNGESMPRSELLARICIELDVSADYLLFGKKHEDVYT